MKKLLKVKKGADDVYLRHPSDPSKLLLRPAVVADDSPMCLKDGGGNITHVLLGPAGTVPAGEPLYLEED